MSGMSITDERKELVSFTEPYLRVGQMALIRRADEGRLPEVTAVPTPDTRGSPALLVVMRCRQGRRAV
jgi:ABC-type amino acid transport substrate-binding protein